MAFPHRPMLHIGRGIHAKIMNTALRDMVGNEHSIMPGEDFSMDEKSFEKNIAGCEVPFTEDGFSLNYGGDCCYGKVAEIAET